MFRLYLFSVICFLCFGPLTGQEEHFTFNNLSEKDGLKNNIVFSFLKDRQGILWIGTQNGLNRFDGSHFISFKKNKHSNSLPNNSVNSLCEDKKGNIWGGTDNGIFRYSPSQNKFTTWFPRFDQNSNIVSNIMCDEKGNIYAATSVSIVKYNVGKDDFQLVEKITESKDSIGIYFLGKNRMLKDDKNHGIWMATGAGLLYYDLSTKQLISSKNANGNPLFSNRSTSAISKSPNGLFCFFDYTNKEVVIFDASKKSIVKNISIKSVDPNARISTLLYDQQNRIWVSNWNFKVLLIDLDNKNSISTIMSKEGNSNTIAADFFWAALQDENGTIWLGTPNGISMCNPGKYVYKPMQLPNKIPVLKNCAIYRVEEDPVDKSWWILTNARILIHYIPQSEKYELYHFDKAKKNSKGLIPQNIFIIKFLNNDVFIPCASGVWRINKLRGTIEPFEILPQKYNNFVVNNFQQVDSLLYCTDGKNLLAYNSKTGEVNWIQYNSSLNGGKPENEVSHLIWQPGHNLFWTFQSDFIAYPTKSHKTHVINLIKDEVFEAGGYIHTADMDAEGMVWVANKGVGLYRYNYKTNETKYWTELDGLVDNHLHSIKADGNGNIWMLYFNRAGVFNPKENSFTNFSIPYSENNLNYFNNLTKRADGIVMGNVNNDVFEFYPQNLIIRPESKMPQLSAVSISGSDYFLDQNNSLVLEAEQNSLRFKFGMVIDATLFPHEFEYKLEGSDANWITSSLSNEANYNNLPPGDYTFRLIAKGKNNTWKSMERDVIITIKAPFYKSKWFVLTVAFSMLTSLFLLYRYRLHQKEKYFNLEGKAQKLEKEKTMVMYQSLKQQLNPHFLFNSLTSLSGLISINQELAASFLEQMSGIYRYILKNGDNETVSLRDEIEFVKLYISLQKTRFKDGLIVEINIHEEYHHYKIAPVTLQNLIENAIKHNIIDTDSPLIIKIYIEDDYIIVENNLQKKNVVETSNKKGLVQFINLYKFLSEKPVIIEETNDHYKIKIPLI